MTWKKEQLCHVTVTAFPSQTTYDVKVAIAAWHSSCLPDHQPLCVQSRSFIHIQVQHDCGNGPAVSSDNDRTSITYNL